MQKPLRFGILGCARIVRRAIVAGIRGAPSAELAAIASRDAALARAWADEFYIPRHYASYDELLGDPDVDAVYIPLPNELHLRWTMKAAAAGKHVLCEKPLALDYEDARLMVDGCRAAGVLLMEAFMWRHHPRTRKAREMLAGGDLGSLRMVLMDFSFNIGAGDWRLDPRRGGGALYDVGCYGINAARLFTGEEPLTIQAAAHLHRSGVDLTTGLLLGFPSGALGVVNCSFESAYRSRIEIVGTAGTLEMPDGALPARATEMLWRVEEEVRRIPFAAADQYAEQVEAFCAGVAAGELPNPAEDGLANMRALDRARQLAWSGVAAST